MKKETKKRHEIVIFGTRIQANSMDIQSLKIDLIHWLTQLKDRTVLEKIQAIKEGEGYDLSPAQQQELDKRLERYEKGDMRFKSWEETKASIRSRSKNGL
jgi:putative addiction module component (TIGR02574 family)